MSDCRVYRRASTSSWTLGRTAVKRPRTWVGICPRCGDRIHGGDILSTRKNTKDALYRHLRSCA